MIYFVYLGIYVVGGFEMNDIRKLFLGILVLDGVVLWVFLGEVYGFIGENGVGKLILIKILVGVY